jgi:hypothetical protein
LGHEKIEVEDIERGIKAYSRDLVTEVDRELTDIYPTANRLIYEFSEENAEFTHDELSILIQCANLDEEQAGRVISLLLYYGVLGIKNGDDDPMYIYDVGYDLESLKVRMRKWGYAARYLVNPALWPALKVNSGS